MIIQACDALSRPLEIVVKISPNGLMVCCCAAVQEGRTEGSFFSQYHQITRELLDELKARGMRLPSV